MVVRHLRIHGRVQGVGYRYSMQAQANSSSVAGWVRNRRDGTVEAMIAGSDEMVEQLIAWAQQGPQGAQVTEVAVEDIAAAESGEFKSFELLPTV